MDLFVCGESVARNFVLLLHLSSTPSPLWKALQCRMRESLQLSTFWHTPHCTSPFPGTSTFPSLARLRGNCTTTTVLSSVTMLLCLNFLCSVREERVPKLASHRSH
ncbi:hypothetical protein, unlikely [Trypanosoma brucei gambiense DAL972]|uniref:Uncharacterized protein n=1 Tax=Trypanosoma brucei gambiense (strain MHOM/CI/86/DAL972) TaxID=679716 RepID=C9ZP12_TRYB9|nr:hypothetical protein, unlikely [Trypanosoma brucei gambiense DAL972]CBH11140.1 hypothetical protein, unlikely [Trypanosoma brucei gambiense DAL972]|eukprot:XP_011773427.1 hypothetical protein, unlikely [Trypanosoma brucei gambiense DAL972]